MKMTGVEYAAIQPGDLSPGAMNVDLPGTEAANQAAAAKQSEEQKSETAAVDRK